jgi:hypothetical protein
MIWLRVFIHRLRGLFQKRASLRFLISGQEITSQVATFLRTDDAMTQALHHLLREGVVAKEETLRHLSPYLTEHINRFGVYDWNSKRRAPYLDYELKILPG